MTKLLLDFADPPVSMYQGSGAISQFLTEELTFKCAGLVGDDQFRVVFVPVVARLLLSIEFISEQLLIEKFSAEAPK